jgi:multiple sugar transport system permease protein
MTKYSTLSGDTKFIGWENYTAVFSDPVFYKSLINTVIFTVGTVPLTAGLALLLAVMLNSRLAKWKEAFRASFFMPSVTSMVVISLIFNNLYSKSGYINSLLSMIGAPFPDRGWLMEPSTALVSIMAMDIWISAGYYMVLFLAGMQAIPDDLYDAARLAGASPWQTFRRITFPLLRNTTMLVLVINTIKAFQVFIEIFVMTKGGPLDSTSTLVYQVYSNAFEKMDMFGYASALAYVVFAILLAMSLLQMKLLKAKD